MMSDKKPFILNRDRPLSLMDAPAAAMRHGIAGALKGRKTWAVLGALYDHLPNIRVGVITLADKLGVSERTVQQALKELRAAGLIHYADDNKGGAGGVHKITPADVRDPEVCKLIVANIQKPHNSYGDISDESGKNHMSSMTYKPHSYDFHDVCPSEKHRNNFPVGCSDCGDNPVTIADKGNNLCNNPKETTTLRENGGSGPTPPPSLSPTVEQGVFLQSQIAQTGCDVVTTVVPEIITVDDDDDDPVAAIFDELCRRTRMSYPPGVRETWLLTIRDTHATLAEGYGGRGQPDDKEATRILAIAGSYIAERWDDVARETTLSRGKPLQPGPGALVNRGAIIGAIRAYAGDGSLIPGFNDFGIATDVQTRIYPPRNYMEGY